MKKIDTHIIFDQSKVLKLKLEENPKAYQNANIRHFINIIRFFTSSKLCKLTWFSRSQRFKMEFQMEFNDLLITYL